ALSLQREALMLHPPGNPYRDNTVNNFALALKTRYDKLDASEDLDETINLFKDSLHSRPHAHPRRHITIVSLSSALCCRFTHTRKNEDVEEAIRLCQESLEALPSLHPDRYFSYVWLKNAYVSHYRVQHNLDVENLILASRHPTHGFPKRTATARDWIVTAQQHETYEA
ncbi:hypothetical protein F4604DRAFT_1590622, partial [Suillus subluteus]